MAKRKFKLSKKEFEKLYLIEKLSPKEIAQKAGTTHWMVYIWRRKYNIPKRKYVPWNKGTKGLMPSGKNHSQWKGGRHQVKSGYILKKVNGENVWEHRYIMEKHINRKLKGNEYIHHLNGIRHDNRIENLAITSPENHEHWTLVKLQAKRIRELEDLA